MDDDITISFAEAVAPMRSVRAEFDGDHVLTIEIGAGPKEVVPLVVEVEVVVPRLIPA